MANMDFIKDQTVTNTELENKRDNRPWWLFAILIVVTCFLFLSLYFVLKDSFFVTQEPVEIRSLLKGAAASSQIADIVDAGDEEVHVWVDTSPNMAGFMLGKDNGCMPSVYKDTFGPNLFAKMVGIGGSTHYTWNRFGNAFETDIDFDDTDLCQPACYQDAKFTADDTAGLIPVLDAIARDSDRNDLYVILTDLEGMLGDAYYDRLQDSFNDIFKGNRSVRIDRYVSSYSGILYDYANSGLNFAFGKNALNQNAVQIDIKGNYLHRQPRAFYMLTIGPPDACERFARMTTSLYNDFYHNNSGETIVASRDHKRDTVTGYGDHGFATYNIAIPSKVALFETGPENSVCIKEKDNVLVPDDISHRAADYNGVAYAIDRSAVKEPKKISIKFQVNPTMIGESETFDMRLIETLNPLYYVLSPSKTYDPGRELETQQQLHARGDRYINMTEEPPASGFEGFYVTASENTNGGYDVEFFIDLTRTPDAVYRIGIPLNCRPDLEETPSQNLQDMQPNAISLSDAKGYSLDFANGRHPSAEHFPFSRTIDLMEIMNRITNGYLSAEQARIFPIAWIEFQLRVQ